VNGASLAVVVREPVDLPPSFEELAQIVVDSDAVGDDYAIVVRPDRYVSAVAKNASDLIAIAKTLKPYSD